MDFYTIVTIEWFDKKTVVDVTWRKAYLRQHGDFVRFHCFFGGRWFLKAGFLGVMCVNRFHKM